MPLYKNMTTKASSNKKKVFFKKVKYRFGDTHSCITSGRVAFKNDFRIEFAKMEKKAEQQQQGHHEKSCTQFGCEFFLLE